MVIPADERGTLKAFNAQHYNLSAQSRMIGADHSRNVTGTRK